VLQWDRNAPDKEPSAAIQEKGELLRRQLLIEEANKEFNLEKPIQEDM
jgi:hypothetical protein